MCNLAATAPCASSSAAAAALLGSTCNQHGPHQSFILTYARHADSERDSGSLSVSSAGRQALQLRLFAAINRRCAAVGALFVSVCC